MYAISNNTSKCTLNVRHATYEISQYSNRNLRKIAIEFNFQTDRSWAKPNHFKQKFGKYKFCAIVGSFLYKFFPWLNEWYDTNWASHKEYMRKRRQIQISRRGKLTEFGSFKSFALFSYNISSAFNQNIEILFGKFWHSLGISTLRYCLITSLSVLYDVKYYLNFLSSLRFKLFAYFIFYSPEPLPLHKPFWSIRWTLLLSFKNYELYLLRMLHSNLVSPFVNPYIFISFILICKKFLGGEVWKPYNKINLCTNFSQKPNKWL